MCPISLYSILRVRVRYSVLGQAGDRRRCRLERARRRCRPQRVRERSTLKTKTSACLLLELVAIALADRVSRMCPGWHTTYALRAQAGRLDESHRFQPFAFVRGGLAQSGPLAAKVAARATLSLGRNAHARSLGVLSVTRSPICTLGACVGPDACVPDKLGPGPGVAGGLRFSVEREIDGRAKW